MRDNFRPNVRLTTNILMVVGTFLIAFNLGQINNTLKEDPNEKFVRDLCKAVALAKVRDKQPKDKRGEVTEIIEELIGQNIEITTYAQKQLAEALCRN
tara:strand:- start:493 stop:786 length:294 start_codon:yes stop_codon:yes gene_type:complete